MSLRIGKIMQDPLRSVNGMLTVPTGPGLGVTIDPAFVKSATALT